MIFLLRRPENKTGKIKRHWQEQQLGRRLGLGDGENEKLKTPVSCPLLYYDQKLLALRFIYNVQLSGS